MSRAKARTKVDKLQLELGMDEYVDKSLLDSFADLEPPKVSKFSSSDALLNKVLKDKSRKAREDLKKAREEAKRKLAGGDAEEDAELAEAEATMKRAKFEESRAELRRKINAHNAPPAFRQCLFVVKEVPEEPRFRSRFADSYRKLLGDRSEFVDDETLGRELLLSGWEMENYAREGKMDEETQRSLFNVATQSTDVELSRKAFDVLAAAFNSFRVDDQILGRQAELRAEDASLYKRAHVKATRCELRDSDFTEAFGRLGYRNPDYSRLAKGGTQTSHAAPGGQTAASQVVGSEQDKRASFPGWEDSERPPLLNNLQLLLRLVARASKQQADGATDCFSGGALQQLLLTVLNLRLDPICSLLSTDLEAAAAALIAAFPDSDWTRKFGDLSCQIAGLGSSHRGAVELIRLLPSDEPRARLLQGHAAVHLLSSLLLPKGRRPATATRSRGAPTEVDPQAVVSSQSWFEGGEGMLRLAKKVNQRELDVWELQSTIELVDLLLWPHIKKSRETGEELEYAGFMAKWRNFCQKLSTHLSKDDQGAVLKLLITTIITRDNTSTL